MDRRSLVDGDVVVIVDEFGDVLEAAVEVVVDDVVVEGELLPPLDFFPGVVYPLLDDLGCFGSPLPQSLF